MFRHGQLREHVLSLDHEDIDLLLPSPEIRRIVDDMIKKLGNFEENTKKVKCGDATVRAAWADLGTMLKNYPTLSDRLEPDARVSLNPLFESRFSKMHEMHEEALTSGEKEEL